LSLIEFNLNIVYDFKLAVFLLSLEQLAINYIITENLQRM